MTAPGRIRAVALDLDGTLTNSCKEITPAVRGSVVRAAESGVAIILASGRPVVGMAHVANELGLDVVGGYILSNNGSKIIDWRSGEVVSEQTLDRRAVEAACRVAHDYGVCALAYDDERMYSEDPSARYVEQERFNNSAVAVRVDDLAAHVTWAPNKMMVVGDPAALVPARAQLEEELVGIADVFLSEPYFIEVTPPGVRKDSALERLVAHLGIELEELLACGDGLNDIPMLKCAGVSVAMANAYPETKEHADWIAPSNDEDGVAAAFDRYVFKEEAC